MEAAVRTVHELVTGKELPRMNLDAVGGAPNLHGAVSLHYYMACAAQPGIPQCQSAVEAGLLLRKRQVELKSCT